jgi:hypothetical protein
MSNISMIEKIKNVPIEYAMVEHVSPWMDARLKRG